MTEQELVKKCLTGICKRLGFYDLSVLTQRDHELISQEIENHTAILISVSTIKRLLNGEFSRMPQRATLNAISTYLGFKNWQEYKISLNNSSDIVNQAGGDMDTRSPKSRNPGYAINRRWVWPAAIAMGVIAIFSFISFSSRSVSHYDTAQFTARKTTDNAIPNTVIFNYNIDKVEADSFFIQQSWDKNRRVRIYKGSYTLTDIYYEPGYHTAKLIANDSIIKTIDVSIPTDRWFLFAKDKSPKSIPRYISSNGAVKNGHLALDKADLDSNRINTDDEKLFAYTYFPKKIEVNSDNYILTARARMKKVRNNYCPYILYEVFCQKRFMFFTSTSTGCASESQLQFGENYVSGKKVDLSPLSADVTQWMDIKMVVKNRQVTIFFNNKPAFTTTYNNPSGLITGLGFFSNGLCEIDLVELKSLDGRVVYQNDFTNSGQ